MAFYKKNTDKIKLEGTGRTMSRKKTTEEWVAEAVHVHSDLYDYTNSVYTGAHNKVVIRCKVHGEFEQRADRHLQGSGCPECVKEARSKRSTLTTEEFIQKAIVVHQNKYDYSLVDYKNTVTGIVVICPEHGEFVTTPHSHIVKENGCAACYGNRVTTTKEFIDNAKRIHGDTYDYSSVEYKNSRTKVTIICPEHGEFKQLPQGHLRGGSCKKCSDQHRDGNSWSYSDWEKQGKVSEAFDGFSLYVIKCVGNGEEFIKVGKTFRGVTKRFSTAKQMPYKYTVVTQVYHNAYAISKLEDKIKREFKKYKYVPERSFEGMYECLSISELQAIVRMAENLNSMFLKKKLKPEHVEDTNYLAQLYWLDDRFSLPRWAYIRSELSHYLVRRLQLEKLVAEHEGQYTLDQYEKERNL